MYRYFRPGKYWLDTEGKKIQAHGGSVLYAEGKYWWYGENKEGVTGRATGSACPIWHNGVRMYSSTDLYNWTDEGVVMVGDDENSPFHPGCIMDRPHILYNERTKKYVLWAKIAGKLQGGEGFENGYFAVCTCDKINGKYEFVGRVENGLPAGDFDLVKEGDTAYVIFEKPHTEMLCATLTEDYLSTTGEVSSHIPKPYPPFVREAPAYFVRNGRKFVLTSGTTGYFPNPTETAEIIGFHGEWKERGVTCRNDKGNNSFHAQFSSVFQHPFKKDLYIALGDRWLTDLSAQTEDVNEIFEEWFSGAKERKYSPDVLQKYSEENTQEATYVWLPVRFDEEGLPYIEWTDRWSIEEYSAEE